MRMHEPAMNAVVAPQFPLGLSDGVVRVSLVHYNTIAEISWFREAMAAVIDGIR
jgi:selenocysteine lyase/cysteine desulfurase